MGRIKRVKPHNPVLGMVAQQRASEGKIEVLLGSPGLAQQVMPPPLSAGAIEARELLEKLSAALHSKPAD